jgi:hypothetical protein
MVKKGQMKIQQMAFMLIGVTLFFVLVGLFALSYFVSNINGEKARLNEQNACLLVTKLANSPEFSCAGAFGTSKSNCVDFDKVRALKNNLEEYEDFWQVDGIEIFKIYPESTEECTETNYPNCELFVLFSPQDKNKPLGNEKYSYVTLCHKENLNNKIYNKCELAKLIVRVSNED